MKVILVNGSSHEKGCTYTALTEIAETLNKNNIETEIFWLGNKAILGCLGCGNCIATGKCCIDDKVNEFLNKAETADGFIFGTPVHFASPSGWITSFMDRAFYGKGKIFKNKPAAGIVSCRRGGATATFDVLNKYFSICSMPIVTSQYWNMVHGNTSEEVKQDLEGMQTMRTLANNMAWLLKCIDMGKNNGVEYPKIENVVRTNFIR